MVKILSNRLLYKQDLIDLIGFNALSILIKRKQIVRRAEAKK